MCGRSLAPINTACYVSGTHWSLKSPIQLYIVALNLNDTIQNKENMRKRGLAEGNKFRFWTW